MNEADQSQLILIIDDNPTMLEMLKDAFEHHGLQPVVAQDGEFGITEARTLHPSAVILDILMPRMNGREVLSQMKQEEDLKHIPVIVFTALADELERQECLQMGATKYFVKSDITPAVLVSEVKLLITPQEIEV